MKVLIFGRNPGLLAMATEPLKAAGHHITACTTDEEAVSLSTSGHFEALVIGMAIEQSVRQTLREKISEKGLQVRIVEPATPADLQTVIEKLRP